MTEYCQKRPYSQIARAVVNSAYDLCRIGATCDGVSLLRGGGQKKAHPSMFSVSVLGAPARLGAHQSMSRTDEDERGKSSSMGRSASGRFSIAVEIQRRLEMSG